MKLKEKLELFSRVSMQEAMEKYTKIIDEIESDFNKAVEEAEKQARKRAEITLQTERYKAEQIKHRETLNVSTECKRALIEHRNELLDGLFADVEAKLKAFAKTAEYKDYLLGQIKMKTENYNNYEIKLRSADMKYADEIKKLTGGNVTEAGDDFIGGFKVILIDKRAVFDATFASKLMIEKRNFDKFKVV